MNLLYFYQRQLYSYNNSNRSMTRNHQGGKQGKNLNGRWSKSQHQRFIKGFQKFGRNWVQVQKVVKTRSLTQVRSHAQKMFMNTQQNGLNASMDSQNSDIISYQQSSFEQQHEQFENEINQAKIQRSRHPRNTSNKNAIGQEMTEKQKIQLQNPQTKQQESFNQSNFHLPQKNNLQKYLRGVNKPSHFLMCITQKWDFFNDGGNFLDLCLGQNPSKTNKF